MAPFGGPAFSKSSTALNDPSPGRWERVPQSAKIEPIFGQFLCKYKWKLTFQRSSFGPVSVQCKFSKMSSKPDFSTPFFHLPYNKMFHNFFRSYRLSVHCKFRNMTNSTLLRECHKTEAFHRVSVLVRGVGETETPCLHSVGETTQICWIFTFKQNSVKLIIFRNLHCTESRCDRKKSWNIL